MRNQVSSPRMSSINFNGNIIPADTPLMGVQNRAMRYGDGLFETLRVIEGHIPFAIQHYQRLYDGMKILSLNAASSFTFSFFKKEILKLTKNSQSRVRFSVFRAGEGLYLPLSNQFDFLIESQPLKSPEYVWSEEGLHLGISEKVRLSCDQLAPLKTISALPYVMAALERQSMGTDDILILNQYERVAEANSSNVLVWTGRTLKTPALTEGCIAGVIRGRILAEAKQLGIKVLECRLSLSDIRNAKSVLLSNSIQGIRWVNRFENCKFAPGIGPRLMNLLNDLSEL